ncbi:HAD family hydrolase [Halococcoides cellulosivorans]|uniref:HAD family hydrolase n=1 Tax=Halococcoides cellulosivorans TaxID=1679096 RepID=A0A2R4X079_9EURY|nr:HAD family hydrolase [Halococcoides cellulosivorans]AWB27208.1 HAD family hydrolase [Halococcoides cellulosivorans]
MDGPIDAVGFDLDETLIVPERDRSDLLASACATAGVAPIDREAYLDAHDAVPADRIDRTREPIFERLCPDDAAALADAYCAAMADAVTLLPQARAAIRVARDRGCRVGICTDGPVRAQRAKLDAVGLSGVADVEVITGAIDARKPDPAVYEAFCDRLGVSPERTLFVGDGPDNDVRGAASAGLRTAQVVTNGATAHPDADAVLDRSTLADGLTELLQPSNELQ